MKENGVDFDEVAYRMNKIPIVVYKAAGMCSCSQSGFLGRIREAISPYRKNIEYREDSAGSEEALRIGIRYRAIAIGSKILQSNPTKKEIEDTLIQEAQRIGLDLE